MSVFRVLHLSDIHIGKTYIDSKEIAYKIISDIEHNGLCSIKCVLVTGDIFDGRIKADTNLIKEAVSFFEKILEQVNIVQIDQRLNKNDFIFIPGNHDIVRVDKLEDRWQKYNDFLVGFYGIIPDFYNVENFSVVRPYKDAQIVFAGFNSCQIEKKITFDENCITSIQNIDDNKMNGLGIDKSKVIKLLQDEIESEYEDYGEIPMSQITDVKRKIRKLDGYNVVALLHHHFYLFPEVVQKYGDSSLVRNYANLIQQLKYMNVKTVLHGHKHFDLERPLITEDYYQSTDSIINIFAGGSVGAKIVDKHTFSVIDFFDGKEDVKLIQNKFIYNGERLEPIDKKQIPPNNSSDRNIKLTESLKANHPDIYLTYTQTIDKMNKTYKTCETIINWTSEALTGFKEVYKFLDNDYRNILFLLYAINYRTLSYKNIIEGDLQNLHSYFEILRKFFNSSLNNADFDVNIDEFHKLFGIKKLELIKDKCDELINKSTSKLAKQYIAFSMVGIFFADLYLVLTEYADDFYEQSIKYKVNIKLDQNKFHQDVPLPSIEIKSDSDRRSVYIQFLCNEATAHKIAVLFVKEFDLIINKFEDYFKLIGLKIYYLLPKIEKNNLKDKIDNYNFEAYIPTLLPLLTGRNIYPLKEVFARELIQNSIDAIAVREAKGENDFSKLINIEIGKDENSRNFFKIKDCGTGMDRFKIERYFTSIGRSFYSGDEYDELNIDYKPISNFGIGFLSSFMVCKEIDVRTKSFIAGSEGLKIHIPNYEGCFFIEREDNVSVGTEIKLYLNDDVEGTKIVDYIQEVMQDIKYDIHIKYNNKGELIKIIPAYSIRKNDKKKIYNFFVPFKESGEVPSINWESEVRTNEYIEKHEYGLLIKQNNESKDRMQSVLNSGILVGQSSLSTIFDTRDEKYNMAIYCNSIFANFPSNWIEIDVSREKSTSFSNIIKKYNNGNPKDTVQNKIAFSLYSQLLSCFEYSKKHKINNSAIHIQHIMKYAKELGNKKNHQLLKDISDITYGVFVKATDDSIEYIVDHSNKTHANAYLINNKDFMSILIQLKERNPKIFDVYHHHKNQRILSKDNEEQISNNMSIFDDAYFKMLQEIIVRQRMSGNKNYTKHFRNYINKLGLYVIDSTIDTFVLVTIFAMSALERKFQNYDIHSMVLIITSLAIESMTISDIENGNNKISIRICDIQNLMKHFVEQ